MKKGNNINSINRDLLAAIIINVGSFVTLITSVGMIFMAWVTSWLYTKTIVILLAIIAMVYSAGMMVMSIAVILEELGYVPEED